MTNQTDSIQTLQRIIKAHVAERGWDPDERGLAISITLEAAELLDHFQWDNHMERPDSHEIPGEVADIAIYLLQFCMKRNIDLGEEVLKKLEKSAKKYPAGQTAEEHYEAKLKHRGKVID